MADRYLLESGGTDGYTLEDGSGVLSLESVATAYTLTANVGAATMAGVSATLRGAWNITASGGSAIARPVHLPPAPLPYLGLLGGPAATLTHGYQITGSAGSAVAAGVAAALNRAYPLVGSVGSATMAGIGATLRAAYPLTASPGAATAAGVSATLTYTPAGVTYSLTADAGAATMAGAEAILTHAVVVAAEPTPQPFGHIVRHGTRVRNIRVEIKDGLVYEFDDAAEAVEVVKTIKRKARRKFHQYERGAILLPPLPEITISGDVPQHLRERVDDANDELEALYARALEADEDDAIVVLFH